jgi:hypothetical protein
VRFRGEVLRLEDDPHATVREMPDDAVPTRENLIGLEHCTVLEKG